MWREEDVVLEEKEKREVMGGREGKERGGRGGKKGDKMLW